jgi:hypothetical protein
MCDSTKIPLSTLFKCDDKTCTIDRQVFDQIQQRMDCVSDQDIPINLKRREWHETQEKHETFRRLDYEKTAIHGTIQAGIFGATVLGSVLGATYLANRRY